jgi:hypothetical protein
MTHPRCLDRPDARRSRLLASFGLRSGAAACLVTGALACGSPDAGREPRDPSVDPESGLPTCGDDPATQPETCVDEWGAVRCKVDSGYAGDELALCEPDPEEGMRIHFGPQDYSDPDAVAPFLLDGGGEDEFCLYVNTPNPTTKYFHTYNGRLRPSSHHLIVTMPEAHHETETVPWHCGPRIRDRWLFGSQDPQIDVGHDEGMLTPEDPDFGLAHDVPAEQTLLIDLHYVNTTQDTILREAWAVLRYMPEEDVRVHSDLIAFYQIRIDVPPLAAATTDRIHCTVPKDSDGREQEVYVALATAHAHERLTRFSLWHDRLDGTSELIYRTLDWAEPGNAVYRDAVQNPPLPLGPGQLWGGKSGYVKVVPGETLSFECDYQNNLDQTVSFGETSRDEMCNVFGHYFPSAGGMWNCFPH